MGSFKFQTKYVTNEVSIQSILKLAYICRSSSCILNSNNLKMSKISNEKITIVIVMRSLKATKSLKPIGLLA
ncbi:hypothetical protein AHAS_Ahas13G0213100 [Arachis hypogaea]